MSDEEFWAKPTEASKIKIEIVSKYFWSWSTVILKMAKKANGLAYVDMFSGRGRYNNGYPSTPIRIIQTVLKNPDLRNLLHLFFNDGDAKNFSILSEEINSLSDLNLINHKPKISNIELSPDNLSTILNEIQEANIKNYPTLFFIDPYGYKGMSLQSIKYLIQGRGNDCIFFLNYNRINMGINNEKVRIHVNNLFGEKQADILREKIKDLSPNIREKTIINEIKQVLEEKSQYHAQTFCFSQDKINRTSHYLIFVSKNEKGHSIIKDIMAKYCDATDQGIPSFKHTYAKSKQLSLLEDYKQLDKLEEIILEQFSGKTLTMLEIYQQHHVGKPYIKSNYKDALKNLEAQEKILTDPPSEQRQKRKGKVTFADEVEVTFPQK